MSVEPANRTIFSESYIYVFVSCAILFCPNFIAMTTRGDADISEEEIDEPIDLQRDGMADMMSRILSQKIDGVSEIFLIIYQLILILYVNLLFSEQKVPVLAKRKTAMMKALEEDAEILKNSKKLKASRPALPVNVELQLLDKDTSIDFERQLKKLATKGGQRVAFLLSMDNA